MLDRILKTKKDSFSNVESSTKSVRTFSVSARYAIDLLTNLAISLKVRMPEELIIVSVFPYFVPSKGYLINY